ncbi:hypothetical protein LJC51_09090 [Lachnospiraceae bacterium OttesenSCG-928-J05]|nr:hypothetical protein [Lachnospiraceae bacterium OttesenSCG-928-J05]
MNAELQHMAELVIAIKSAMKTGKALKNSMEEYLEEVVFIFAPVHKLFRSKGTISLKDVNEWFAHLQEKGLQDIMLLAESQSDINLLGFANGLQNCVIGTQYDKDGAIWAKQWNFDQNVKKWSIFYRETARTGEMPKVQLSDPTIGLHHALQQIAELADSIDATNFANIFRKSDDELMGIQTSQSIEVSMPEKNQRLYKAATNAWVFGAMGSWNDSPPYMAKDKGLSEEYDMLTSKLYGYIIEALIFSVNIW